MLLSGLLALPASGCLLVSHRIEVQPVNAADGVAVDTPVRAHLSDGSTGVYTEGFTIANGMLRGRGFFYDLSFQPLRQNPLLRVPLDSVTGLETFHARVNRGKTLALLPLSIPLSAIAVGAGAGPGGATPPGLDKFPPSSTGRGPTVTIQMGKRRIVAELIEVRDDGMVVLDQKLRFVPYSAIDAASFAKLSSRHSLKEQLPPAPDTREQLRLMSRFPQNIPPAMLQQLLKIHKQAALASIDE